MRNNPLNEDALTLKGSKGSQELGWCNEKSKNPTMQSEVNIKHQNKSVQCIICSQYMVEKPLRNI